MKLLIVSKNIHAIYADNGEIFLNHNFNEETISHYSDICGDDLSLFVRDSGLIMSYEEACTKYNRFNRALAKLYVSPYIFSPKTNFFNIKLRLMLAKQLKRLVKKTDRLICTEGFCIFARLAIKYAKRYDKPYMIMSESFVFEGLVAHSLLGKLRAPFEEFICKRHFKNAPYAMYVTQTALQKRYPCNGKTLGCSDAFISYSGNEQKSKRLERINSKDRKIIIGTLGYIDHPIKGQAQVIKAMKILMEQGFTNYEYHITGSGNGIKLKKLITMYNLENSVKIVGAIPHNEVFAWLDTVDIYIQPSFSEGLSRAIIEAMGRGCPVAGSYVGGNRELVAPQYSFNPKNVHEIVSIIKKLSHSRHIEQAIKYSQNRALEFSPTVLNAKKKAFFRDFVEEPE